MVIAALVVFVVLLVAWLVAPSGAPRRTETVAPTHAAPDAARLAEAT